MSSPQTVLAIDVYARRMFACAAAFNLSVAFGGFFLFPQIATWLDLSAGGGETAFWRNLFMALVMAFGVAYALVAVDHRRYRPYALLGIIGKTLVVLVGGVAVLQGLVSPKAVTVMAGDVVFALLFADFLRRAPD